MRQLSEGKDSLQDGRKSLPAIHPTGINVQNM
jgi:hypothetical protein